MSYRYFLGDIGSRSQTDLPFLAEPGLRVGPNLSPGEVVTGVFSHMHQTMQSSLFRWGLISTWERGNPHGQKPLTSLEIESVRERGKWSDAYKRRRLVLPAHGYVVWSPEDDRSRPYRLMQPKAQLFGIAAVWEAWKPRRGPVVHTCAMLTRQAAPRFQPIAKRVPVMLPPQLWSSYLWGYLAAPDQVIEASRHLAVLDVVELSDAQFSKDVSDRAALRSSRESVLVAA